MGVRIELDDLPPRYQQQVRRKLAERRRRKRPQATGGFAVPPAENLKRAFDSRGEYEFYIQACARVQRGEIARLTPHVKFALLPEKEFCGVKLPAAHYTADFVLLYPDGMVEVVEIKSKFVRRSQRDYIYRRRLLVDLILEPRGWRFTEIITPDSRQEIKEWRQKYGNV